MTYVFVDESGNLGKEGRYFVLAAVVFTTEKGRNRIKRIIRKEQQLISKDNGTELIDEIKGKDLTFTQKQRIINKMLLREDMDIYYFIADKPQVKLLQSSASKNLVYNYFASLLMAKIFDQYNSDFNIIFDQRSTAVKSMNSLSDYLTINAYTKHNQFKNDVKIIQSDSRSVYNLQAADIVSGIIHRAYSKNSSHFLRMLRPRIKSGEEFPNRTFPNKLLSSLDQLPLF